MARHTSEKKPNRMLRAWLKKWLRVSGTDCKKMTGCRKKPRQQRLKKLDAMKIHIGYPDKLDGMYALLKVDENKSLYENNRSIQTVIEKNRFAKLDQTINRDEWRTPGHTANANYQYLTNTMTFPAAALQAPFYDKNKSASWNYGGIGAVIGHEISHAFDTNGAKYDEVGNKVNWWSEEDYKKFEEKAQAFVEQYNKAEYIGRKVNGQRTVPENIADIGGLNVALELAKQQPDANLEDFYTSWATIWRHKALAEIDQYLLLVDPNPPSKIRVNAVVANSDDFYSTFGVKKGDKMYIAPEDRITLW